MIRMSSLRVNALLLMIFLASSVYPQAGGRSGKLTYGVNLTLAIYQCAFPAGSDLEAEFLIPQTFDSAKAEAAYLTRTYQIDELVLRYVGSVGLNPGGLFRDGAYLGETSVLLSLEARTVSRASARISVTFLTGDETVLGISELTMGNYETVGMRVRSGQNTEKDGRRGEKPSGTTTGSELLVTATAVIVPDHQLRNRPHDYCYPADQYGHEVKLEKTDVFWPPIVLKRVTPRRTFRRGSPGTVVVEALVTPDARLLNLRVLRSFDESFNNQAVDALSEYQVSPARLNGAPVYAVMRQEVSFLSDQ